MGIVISFPESARVAAGRCSEPLEQTTSFNIVETDEAGNILSEKPFARVDFLSAPLDKIEFPEGPRDHAFEYRWKQIPMSSEEAVRIRREAAREVLLEKLGGEITEEMIDLQLGFDSMFTTADTSWAADGVHHDPKIGHYSLALEFVRWVSLDEFDQQLARALAATEGADSISVERYSLWDSIPLPDRTKWCEDCDLKVTEGPPIGVGCRIGGTNIELAQFWQTVGERGNFSLLLDRQAYTDAEIPQLRDELVRAREILTRTTLPILRLYDQDGRHLDSWPYFSSRSGYTADGESYDVGPMGRRGTALPITMKTPREMSKDEASGVAQLGTAIAEAMQPHRQSITGRGEYDLRSIELQANGSVIGESIRGTRLELPNFDLEQFRSSSRITRPHAHVTRAVVEKRAAIETFGRILDAYDRIVSIAADHRLPLEVL